MAQKIFPSPAAALEDVLFDSMTIMSGGFGYAGNPESLIAEIFRAGTKDLTVISNNCGNEDFGLWFLLTQRQISKAVCSYLGVNRLFQEQCLAGEIAFELTAQGTM